MSFKSLRKQIATLAMVAALLPGIARLAGGADGPDAQALEQVYQPQIRPLLELYCFRCHAEDRTEADIDLAAFATMADVRGSPRIWQNVGEMLDSEQMPPRKSRQPSAAQRARLREWVRDHLTAEARAHDGDPGRVVLRRLSNSEYTYTARDLTGVEALDPVREFPVDGAAGEGFTNTGDALVMSPSLLAKYLDAAKEIASHAVLLPDGIRFSPRTTRRDWTDESLARIRTFYREFTDDGGATAVNLQGIKFDTDQGGRLPLKRYLEATIAEREALSAGRKSVAAVARERNLKARYLGTLWQALSAEARDGVSLPLERVRALWRTADVTDVPALVEEIGRWQQALWKFNSIGHSGREGGASSWMEPVNPVLTQQEFKLKLPRSPAGEDVVLYLAVGDAGDGSDADLVVWKNPRLEGAGRPALSLRYAAGLQKRLAQVRRDMLAVTTRYLAAVAGASPETTVPELAARHDVDAGLLEVWLDYLKISTAGSVEVTGHYRETLLKVGNYDFVNGWGTAATPSVAANSSDQQVRIPGIARPHSVVAHPSPTLFTATGWHSPVDGMVRVEARLADAHPECGNGVEWVLQHRTRSGPDTLWKGDFAVRGSARMPPRTITVHRGELVSFILGPRQGDHGCDLTSIDLTITEIDGAGRVWDLAKDVSGNLLEGNPHADSHGNTATWHFYRGEMAKVSEGEDRPDTVPAGSLLAQWRAEKDPESRGALARRVEVLATGEAPADRNSPDAALFGQLAELTVPIDLDAVLEEVKPDPRFGTHPSGLLTDPADLVVQAPAVVEFRLPADLAGGREFVVTGQLESRHGREGSVQLQVLRTAPDLRDVSPAIPITVTDGSDTRRRVESSFEDFRQLFPGALCYAKIVPVDEVVTLTLFHREDGHLQRLMLDEDQAMRLDRLWDELNFVSREPLEFLVALEQITAFATQDRPDLVKAFKPLHEPTRDRARRFEQRLVDTEPTHVDAVMALANRAWRRNLSAAEEQGLRRLYRGLRDEGLTHDEAIRLTLTRVLTSPAFLYRLEQPAPGEKAAPVSNEELATRLSYFLWGSMPDDELRRVAASGTLSDEKILVAQTRRMLDNDRMRRLAIDFACQWLHIRDFDKNDAKNAKLYPQFATLRGDMYEESVRFFKDMFRNNGSVLGLLNADHSFLNESLARHYGIDGVSGPAWRRVDGVNARGRGGVLGMAAVLAKQSGASRTSPILRGNWVYETLLGERLPRPPAKVPELPDAVPGGLTARQLIEHHSSTPECARCHVKIDPYGFALEQYDAIGRLRPQAVDTRTELVDGTTVEGIDGLRDYLLKDRHDDVLQQFCRKLLGYALGRVVQLSDRPLLGRMQRTLETNGYRFGLAVEAIVTSRQFREIRGQATTEED